MNRLSKGKVLVGALSIDAQDITISDDLVVGGDSRTAGVAAVKRSAATIADGGSMVASAANIITNTIVSATPTTGRNVTLANATDVIALCTNFAVGDTTEFTVINLAAATHALTLLDGTGTSIIGSATIAAASSATFYVRIASGTTIVLYRK
jgi:hypothetical protein